MLVFNSGKKINKFTSDMNRIAQYQRNILNSKLHANKKRIRSEPVVGYRVNKLFLFSVFVESHRRFGKAGVLAWGQRVKVFKTLAYRICLYMKVLARSLVVGWGGKWAFLNVNIVGTWSKFYVGREVDWLVIECRAGSERESRSRSFLFICIGNSFWCG